MYAVIKTGGKQYRVSQGDKLRVESLAADEGSSISLDQVLMVGEGTNVTVGEPLVSSASVSATVVAHGRGKKVDIVKFRRRKHHRKQMGHRQNYTELEITGISGGPAGASSSSDSKAADAAAAEKAAAAAAEKAKAADEQAKADKAAADKAKAEQAKAEQAEADAIAARENETQQAVQEAASQEAAPAPDVSNLKFLDAPDGSPDDLKKISGVGPVLEEKLNEMGIYHFRQIAAFTQQDIDNVNAAMDFPGRIERDEWIAQADELAKG